MGKNDPLVHSYEFQSTLPQGEPRQRGLKVQGVFGISIHAPTRGATDLLSPIYEFASNFNPRSRKGSDDFLRRLRCGPIISTHAPARGATRTEVVPYQSIEISTHAPARGATIVRLGHFFIVCYISTHAPARGATQIFWFCMQNHRNFNPRSRKGSDIWVLLRLLSGLFQPTLPQGERQK